MPRSNAVLWITCALPLITVAASFLTLGAAVLHPDSELPEQYHWEGVKLDRDFARAERAASLGVQAVLDGFGRAGACRLQLRLRGASPAALTVRMIHATQPSLDRSVALRRRTLDRLEDRTVADYTGECQPMRDGHWRVELTDAEHDWSIRQSIRGGLAEVRLEAAPPQER